ncbi:MAG TPA: flagellar motor switch protein FliN [Eoetvoesiella sp.]
MTDPTQDPANDNSAPDNAEADWAAALSEQAGQARQPTQADGLQQDIDDWASALAEQTASASAPVQPQPAPEPPSSVTPHVFQPLLDSAAEGNSDIDMIMDIPVQLSVELGRTKLTIKNILQLGQGSVVELDGLAGEPMDIFVNGYLIAQGEVVVVDDKYGIRLTDIITPSDRLSRLNGRR